MRTIAEIIRELPVSLEGGLAAEGVSRSRGRFGANELTALPRPPFWQKFLEKLDEPIIKILLAAALLSLVVDLFRAAPILGGVASGLLIVLLAAAWLGKQQQWLPSLLFGSALAFFLLGLLAGHVLVEGLAVMVAVILATGVAFLSEFKSDREFEILNARKRSLQAKVLRQGKLATVPLEDVVVGDLVLLEMGDEVPADGRLARATELYVDQSLMTGESEPQQKLARPHDETEEGPDQPGCLYRGTQVVDGVGQMLVTDVGNATALGQIARRLSGEDDAADAHDRVKQKLTISKELTPLQQKLARLAELISKVGYIAAALIFLAQLIRGLIVGEIFLPGTRQGFGVDFLDVFGELLGYFVTMVIIIVVAVPEGLPMSVTVSLALAMRKMTRANSLVRQLVACETIGSATVICTDKTGTLTQNKMQVERLSWGSESVNREHPAWPKPAAPFTGATPRPIDWIVLNAAVNSTAHLEEKDGKLLAVGNFTEGSLLHWLRESGLEYAQLRLQFEPLYQVHFSSERKRMTTVIRRGGQRWVLVKGAPEWVLEQCSRYLTGDGRHEPLTAAARQAIDARVQESAAQAMRTLAFAVAQLPDELPDHAEALHAQRDVLERDLVYVGFAAIRDPLRHDVKEAMAQCRQAGIAVKMVTGDSVEIARAIGTEIGLLDRADAKILTSQEFNALEDGALKEQLPALAILARARPLDKLRLVRLLQELGEVVAVTGDGTNDAPALKKADVGLAMGRAGTEVAKEASKIVLLDDAFSTIVKAVHWGRSLYENIQRFIQFQLTINVSALTITFLGILFFNVKAPFTVLQLLWVNVIMDTFASIALCSEPPRPGLMSLPPRRRDENILTLPMVRNILVTASYFVVVMLVLLVNMKGQPEPPAEHGWFAGSGPWLVEASGVRLALPREDLERDPRIKKFRIKEDANVAPSLRGQDVYVAFTVFQVSIFFSIYVFFQVWNQINCRSLTPERSGLTGIWRNPTFLAIAAAVAIGQIVIVTFGGNIFKVEPLSFWVWLAIIAFTSSVLIFAEIARAIRARLEARDASNLHTKQG